MSGRGGDIRSATGARRMGLAVIGALTVALLLSSAPALALSQRGHVFNSTFGSGGSAADEFSNPSGVAVNESTGDVYVADQGNNRIRMIALDGGVTTLAGNGNFGLVDGSGGPHGTAEFDAPTGVAVDGSGNVYVADFYSSCLLYTSRCV